jgi:D-glycero-alpha-D-manno-heptose-7-phosphate kinase
MTTRIRATAPVRVADVGGWTDTWFAGSGRVCSIAAEPGAYVEICLSDQPGPITLNVGSTGEQYSFTAGERPERHPLLEAAIAALPPRTAATINVGADVPPGSGLGTSAAVGVALLAALAAAKGMDLSPAELAAMAHGVETGLGWQSGVQDQWAAAYGGVNELSVEYPDVQRRSVDIDAGLAGDLSRRLMTVYLGRPHSSSELHEEVITTVAMAHPGRVFRRLREAAEDGARALVVGDLGRFGAAMIESHEAVRQLHPGLIGERAELAISIARACGALGWKMNGAGGDGGTVTILGPEVPYALDTMRQSLGLLNEARVLDLSYCPDGVHTTTAQVDD